MKQCEEISERLKLNKKLFNSGKNVELSFPRWRPHCMSFPSGLPLNLQKLKEFCSNAEYSDVNIYVEDLGPAIKSHKLVLSLWSVPFAKMFTNGMSESTSAQICVRDVSPEALKAMLDFMYSGDLNMGDTVNSGYLLLQLLILADRFGVTFLHQECCKVLMEYLSEDTVFPILRAISPLSSCKLVEERCQRYIATHFDYCTTATFDFTLLDKTTFSHIIQHPDLTVTSEERVLISIIMWCSQAKKLYRWEELDELMTFLMPESLFGESLLFFDDLLPSVRFALLPHSLLKKLEKSNLSRQFPVLNNLVEEALKHVELVSAKAGNDPRHLEEGWNKFLVYINGQEDEGKLFHHHKKRQQPYPKSLSPISKKMNKVKGTKFVGVRQRPSGKWVAEIKDTTQKIRMWLGTFDTAEEAARAYDEAACLLRGSNTRTNFSVRTAPLNSGLSVKIRNLLNRKLRSRQNLHSCPPAIPTCSSIITSSNTFLGNNNYNDMSSGIKDAQILLSSDAYRPDLSSCLGGTTSYPLFDQSWGFDNGFSYQAPLVQEPEEFIGAEFERMKVERQISASLYAMNGVNEYLEKATSEAAVWELPSLSQLFCFS